MFFPVSPPLHAARREMLYDVSAQLDDLATVLGESEDHRSRLLLTGANNLRSWYTKVRKIKAIYHCLNLFSFDVTQKVRKLGITMRRIIRPPLACLLYSYNIV